MPVLGEARTEVVYLCASCWDMGCLNYQYSLKNVGGKVAIFTFQLGVEFSCSYLSLDPFQLGYISLKEGVD